jgi:hypothetical protein
MMVTVPLMYESVKSHDLTLYHLSEENFNYVAIFRRYNNVSE